MSLFAVLEALDTLDAYDATKSIPLDLEVYTFYSQNDYWRYHAVFDERICPDCVDKSLPGIYPGNHLRANFKYLLIYDENFIWATVHPNCLKPETVVHTVRGLVPVEDVVLGDLVLTHKGRYRRVIQLHKNPYEGNLYSVNGNWMTGNHPVLTQRGWVNAEDLGAYSSDLVYQQRLPSILNSVETEAFKGFVYNLSIDEDESYLIGDRGLVVHNCRCWLERVFPVGETT